MAFNLQKVLRALLFSSSQALSIKDVQDIFARFHEQAPAVAETDEEASSLTAPIAADETSADPVSASESAEANDSSVAAETQSETSEPQREPEPEPDPEAPSLKPAELLSAQTQSDETAALETTAQPAIAGELSETTEVVVQAPEDTDAELYQDVPTLITAAQIREAMDAISTELRAANDIYILVEGPTGYRLMTHPRYARWIRIMRDEPPPVKLTQSALETLAVVAYRQPVTRSEIESIRGVSAEAGLSKLMERELVYITGRADLPGRPLQYSTTDKFLEFVGVKSLVELPASDVLSPRQIDAWLQNAAKVTPPSDAEMGLPLEEGEGETPNLANVSVEHTTPPFEAGSTGEEAASAPAEDSVATEPPALQPQEESPSPSAEQPDQTDQPDQSTEPSSENQPEKSE